MKIVMALAVVLCMQGTIFAQAASKPVEFEVASVRQAAPSHFRPGQGSTGVGAVTITADRATYRDITLKSLLMRAYSLEAFQVSGPAWIDSERYDVVATIPEGASKEDVPAMLQHLLAVRFRMTLHAETKEHAGYVLGVGKGGPKLKAAADASRPRAGMRFLIGADSVTETYYGATMPAFAEDLSRTLSAPVIDSTGHSGKYDIVLSISRGMTPFAQVTGTDGSQVESDSSTASLFTAIHDLGLTLEARKAPLTSIVVDQAEKIPIVD